MSVQQAGTEAGALRELEEFPLVEALFGRRSRRFSRGGEIPDGPLAYRSGQEPVPLSELERMLVPGAMGGTTGWHFSITRHARYAPHASNYPARPRGARSRRRPGSTPPNCSSPTTRACTCSRPATPARWWTRPPSR